MEKKTVHRISVRPIESSPHKKNIRVYSVPTTVCLFYKKCIKQIIQVAM